MLRTVFSTFTLVFFALSASLILSGSLAFAGPPVDFKLVNGHVILVPVWVNGSGPIEFILDTGSNDTLLDPSLLGRLAKSPSSEKRLVTTTGSTLVLAFRLERLELGGRFLHSVEVLSYPIPRAGDSEPMGILGQNFLEEFNFVLDYTRRQLFFEENSELEERLLGSVYSVQNYGKRVVVQVPPQSVGSRPSLFVLDSGSAGLVLFGNNFRGLGFDLDQDVSQQRLFSVVGLDTVNRRKFRVFKIGETTFKDVPVWVSDNAVASRYRTENGLLPTHYFQAIYFNNAKKFVAFNPRFESREVASSK